MQCTSSSWEQCMRNPWACARAGVHGPACMHCTFRWGDPLRLIAPSPTLRPAPASVPLGSRHGYKYNTSQLSRDAAPGLTNNCAVGAPTTWPPSRQRRLYETPLCTIDTALSSCHVGCKEKVAASKQLGSLSFWGCSILATNETTNQTTLQTFVRPSTAAAASACLCPPSRQSRPRGGKTLTATQTQAAPKLSTVKSADSVVNAVPSYEAIGSARPGPCTLALAVICLAWWGLLLLTLLLSAVSSMSSVLLLLVMVVMPVGVLCVVMMLKEANLVPSRFVCRPRAWFSMLKMLGGGHILSWMHTCSTATHQDHGAHHVSTLPNTPRHASQARVTLGKLQSTPNTHAL